LGIKITNAAAITINPTPIKNKGSGDFFLDLGCLFFVAFVMVEFVPV
jgi:hypothetical protein